MLAINTWFGGSDWIDGWLESGQGRGGREENSQTACEDLLLLRETGIFLSIEWVEGRTIGGQGRSIPLFYISL